MGGGSWDPNAWKTASKATRGRSVSENFTARKIDSTLDPKNIRVRESRDSEAHPNSLAVILAGDVTGSMGMCANVIIQKGLGLTMEALLAEKDKGYDPQIMVAGIGDFLYDKSPLQLTQFETEVGPMVEQTQKIFIEGGGGGNNTESYDGIWLAGAMLTSIDCFEKRKKKGYIFTIGDERAPRVLTKEDLLSKAGISVEDDVASKDALEMAERTYNVFHVIVAEGSHARYSGIDVVKASWLPLLGQRVLILNKLDDLAEVIVSAIRINEGENAEDVIGAWSGGTAVTVREAVKGMTPAAKSSGGLTRLGA